MSAMRLPLACFALLVLAAAPARAGGIVNGSFEAPTEPVGGFLNYFGGSTAITGWSVKGTGVSIVSVNNNNASLDNVTLNSAAVPEPAGITLMAIGLAATGIVLASRRERASAALTARTIGLTS
jgi:hypothetical protein